MRGSPTYVFIISGYFQCLSSKINLTIFISSSGSQIRACFWKLLCSYREYTWWNRKRYHCMHAKIISSSCMFFWFSLMKQKSIKRNISLILFWFSIMHSRSLHHDVRIRFRENRIRSWTYRDHASMSWYCSSICPPTWTIRTPHWAVSTYGGSLIPAFSVAFLLFKKTTPKVVVLIFVFF